MAGNTEFGEVLYWFLNKPLRTVGEKTEMSTMVEAKLPAEQFALSETLYQYPDAEFDVLRLAADGSDSAMPFLRVSGDDIEDLLSQVDQDPTTENVDVVAELDDEYLLRLDWTTDIRLVPFILIDEDAIILEAMGKHRSWRFRILFQDHDAVAKAYDHCLEYDIDLEVERIYQLSESLERGQCGLSESQYQTIRYAYQKGYYDVPREVNLQELAKHMGISHQALSERVRRGHETLIANTLNPEIEPVTQS